MKRFLFQSLIYDNCVFIVMNELLNLSKLNNQYYGLRHGKSTANDEHIIVSNAKDGVVNYGLTDEGREQVIQSVSNFDSNLIMDKIDNYNFLIVTSDFKRACETAEITSEFFEVQESIFLTELLRERFFGDFDKKGSEYYSPVWAKDLLDSSQSDDNVESVDSVITRTTKLVKILEEKYSDYVIFLVAHGDVLTILESAFKKIEGSKHRSLGSFKNAEIRLLNKVE